VFLAVESSRISTRVGGAAPWRLATVLAAMFLGTFLFTNVLDGVMWALDRKHVLVGPDR